jgi:hypothetical protein
MRTTVDIPDPIYRELKERAAREGTSVRQIIVESILSHREQMRAPGNRKKLKFPLVVSKQPGSLNLGEEGVYEYIPFP